MGAGGGGSGPGGLFGATAGVLGPGDASVMSRAGGAGGDGSGGGGSGGLSAGLGTGAATGAGGGGGAGAFGSTQQPPVVSAAWASRGLASPGARLPGAVGSSRSPGVALGAGNLVCYPDPDSGPVDPTQGPVVVGSAVEGPAVVLQVRALCGAVRCGAGGSCACAVACP